MRYTFTFIKDHYDQLKNHFLREDGRERAAFIICGRSLAEDEEDRFLSKEIRLLGDDELLTSHSNQVSWNNNIFVEQLKKAEQGNRAVVVIHNHPMGFAQFSDVDDNGEYHLFKLAFNRNEGTRPHASLIMLPDGSFIGRVWKHDLTTEPINHFRVIGKTIQFFYPERGKNNSPEAFHRQQLAFGNALVEDLSRLKITIVGAGATGSATAVLLARLGVGELRLIDKDKIEVTNLSRLHGASKSQVGESKVMVLKDHIEKMGLKTKVLVIDDWVSSKSSIRFLKTSDLIFGCTDDNAGRILLNRFAYFYLVPVIDMGLVISVKNDPPEIQDLQGRISYLFPGSDCLITKGVINTNRAYAENISRDDPEQYKNLKEEAYVIGEGNPAPAVVTFTTQVASMAVNELLNRMVVFNPQGFSPHKIYFFHRGIEITPANIPNNDCRICGSSYYWGKGDMIPFLDMSL